MPRLMEISTPLGEDLLFHGMRAREELGRPGTCHLDLLSTRGNIDLDEILGKNVTVTVTLQDDSARYFNGYVTRFAQRGMYGRYHRYTADVSSWLWFLTRTADCRIFQDLTVPDIVKQVFGEHQSNDFAMELTGSYRTRTYCVQYRETDFNFVSRLLEEEGIYYYVRHTDGHNTLVLADSTSAHTPTPGYEEVPFAPPGALLWPEEEHLGTWELRREIQPGVYAHADYDFERPSVKLRAQKSRPRGYTPSDYEMFDYPGRWLHKGDGEQYADIRIDEYATQHELAEGAGNARGLCTGSLVTLTGHPREDQNREYLIVAAEHDLVFSGYEGMPEGESGASFRCSVVVIPAQQQFRPRRATPKPFVQGPQTAKVTGPAGEEIYTDALGRVKVQFHWDRYGTEDENSSCWVRVSHPWAGKGWGAVSTPRIGQEVVVDFLEGDPDQPIVTGRVYNAEAQPPFGFPAGAVVSGMKSQTHKGTGYNEISADDTAGREKITIHGQYDMNTTVEHDQTNTVNNDFTETIRKNATISVSEGNLSHDVVAGTATYHVKGAVTENYDSTQKTTVKQAIDIVSTGGPIAISADSQHVYINAATSIQLHVGESMIWMDAGGQINIKGINVAINGASSVTIKGGMVHSEAQSQHQTKGAIVLSEGSATNTVKGGMVMLNP